MKRDNLWKLRWRHFIGPRWVWQTLLVYFFAMSASIGICFTCDERTSQIAATVIAVVSYALVYTTLTAEERA